MRVLVAEDDTRIAADIAQALEAAGYVVECESDGEEIWFKGDTEDYDAVVLDLGLPGMDGLAILRKWRAAGRDVPVLILTARGVWSERVEGIDAGADDYLVKPFEMAELLARLRAVIRRHTGHASSVLRLGDLSLDTRLMQASLRGVPLALTPNEFRLMSYLMHHAGRVVSQMELTEHIYHQDFERDSNSIEALVARLRRKIGAERIRTRRGFGYYMPAEASDSGSATVDDPGPAAQTEARAGRK